MELWRMVGGSQSRKMEGDEKGKWRRGSPEQLSERSKVGKERIKGDSGPCPTNIAPPEMII
jgi:hypothetical protein